MSTLFGVNQVSQFDPFSVFAGDFQRIPEEVTAGEDLRFLSVVKQNSDGTVSLVTSKDDVIYGVIYEVQYFEGQSPGSVSEYEPIVKAGGKCIALTSGEFLGRHLVIGAPAATPGPTWQELEVNLRAANAPMWFRANPSKEMAGRV